MSFQVVDNKLFKKYIKIWETVSNLISIEFDSKPVYDDTDKYIKIKIKSYGDKVSTNWVIKYQKKMHHTCVYH